MGTPDLLDLAVFPRGIAPPGVTRLVIDQDELASGAYDDAGRLLCRGPMSGGKAWCSDTGHACRTRPGCFAINRAQGAGCASKKLPIGRGGAQCFGGGRSASSTSCSASCQSSSS